MALSGQPSEAAVGMGLALIADPCRDYEDSWL